MTDFWGWVEADVVGEVFPTYGLVIGRTQFPPNPDHPAVHFCKYDPVTPDIVIETSDELTDYVMWSGWNANKSKTYIMGLKVDIPGVGGPFPADPPLGTDLHIVPVDTTDDILMNWVADYSNPYFVPTSLSNFSEMRFIPGTDHVVFMAMEAGKRKLFRLRTDTNTLDILFTDINWYAYSYNEQYLVVQYASILGTRVYTRDSAGAPITEVSSGDIFGFVAREFFFSDDSLYILAFDGSHHVIHEGSPPFALDITVPSNVLSGLNGPQLASITDLAAHPTRDYIARITRVSLGLGGANASGEVMTWFGEHVQNVSAGEHGHSVEWSQSGDALVIFEDGRDPYGGFGVIYKEDTWVSDSFAPQHWGSVRIRPYH